MDVRSSVVEASSSEALKQQPRERAVDAVVFQVLDNPSLREEILKQVIFGKGTLDRKARLHSPPCPSQLERQRAQDPMEAHQHLFKLGRVSTEAEEDLFVETFAASTEVMGSLPPLVAPGFGDLSYPENLDCFSDCLTRCGSGLIQVVVWIREHGRPFLQTSQHPIPINLLLQRLHKMDIKLDLYLDTQLSRTQVEEQDMLSTCLIKSMLRSATSLSELKFNIRGHFQAPPERSPLPVLNSVFLPPSITKIKISVTEESTQHQANNYWGRLIQKC